MLLALSFILLVFTFPGIYGVKWLMDQPGFDNPQAWVSEYLPCSMEDVVFPSSYDAVLPLPKNVDIKGLILPNDGAILLKQDSTITLGGPLTHRDCENGGDHKAYLKKPQALKWFDPKSWRSTAKINNNVAIMDMERVPCMNDSIIIPTNGALSINLENVNNMRLGQLNIAGSLLSKKYLINLIKTEIGQYMFKNSEFVNVEYYKSDICGCHKNFPELFEPICHNVIRECPKPHCLKPIMPLGSCCLRCGATLSIYSDKCDNAKYHKIKNLVESTIKEKGLQNELDYSLSYFDSNNIYFLQLLIMDKNGYQQKSVAFTSELKEKTKWNDLLGIYHAIESDYSGSPYNPNVTWGSIILIILCMLLISFMGLVIFAHYVPNHPYLGRIPQWIHDPLRWRAFILRHPAVFARFDNSAGNEDVTVENDPQQQIVMAYEAGNEAVRKRAFDNPMFGEKATTTTAATVSGVQDLKAEASSSKLHIPKLETGSLEAEPAVAEEEQELTEIKLDSESEEEEGIKETKK